MNERCIKWIAVILTIALMLSAFPLFSFVSAETVEVSTAEEFIETINGTTDSGKNLTLNILSDFELSHSIEADFAGTINGNGHVITVSTGTALFNEIKEGAFVNNLGVIVNASAPVTTPGSGKAYRGILANYISGSVSGCFVYGSINAAFQISGQSYVGGFCGSLTETGSISDSFSCVSIKTANTTYSGGFAGIVRPNAIIRSCYSSGDIDAIDGYVAGFANGDATNVTDTYTSCQLVNVSNDAKPSGVNGVYDNQLSVMRESLENPGLSTKALITDPGEKLSADFVVTSTAYPALNVFIDDMWSDITHDIVEVSTTAAIFLDVNPSVRMEPSEVLLRADYLTYESYVDRTNVKNMFWSIETSSDRDGVCKIFDTVPTTSFNQSENAVNSTGGSADLLRAKLKFYADAEHTKMRACKNGFSRVWHLNAYDCNPYFAGGNGMQSDSQGDGYSPFEISNADQLNAVRFYSLIDSDTQYKVINDFTVGDFDPIVDFSGNFNGGNFILSDAVLADDRDGDIGLFANTRQGSVVEDVVLSGVQAVTDEDTVSGSLIGSAVGTTVSNVMLKGTSSTVQSAGCAGGLIGKATDSVLTHLLVSVQVDGATAGGLVGELLGSTLIQSGSTGLVGGKGAVLGGLVGLSDKSDNAVSPTISHCYSTAVVLSNHDDAKAGGLAGVASDGDISDCYFAGMSAVKITDIWTQASPLVSSGTVSGICSYDGQFYDGDTTAVSVSGDAWTLQTGFYPQLTHFVDTDLSSFTTAHFIYQQYWSDIETAGDSSVNDITTGWIPKSTSSVSFTKPVVATDFCSETAAKTYEVNDSALGFGFEPAAGQQFTVVKTTGSHNNTAVGVRYACVVRNDLVPLSYQIAGNTSDRVYVEISYGSQTTGWTTLKFNSVGSAKTVYDIPKGNLIRVRILSDDDTVLSSVTANGAQLSATNGYFTSSNSYSVPVTLVITLSDNTFDAETDWGVRREAY